MKWWGYQYTNGKLQVKRYFTYEDIRDAEESDFVSRVSQPFDAEDREEAIKRLKNKFIIDE